MWGYLFWSTFFGVVLYSFLMVGSCNILSLCELSELILWGHLLASGPDFYIIGRWLWLWGIMDVIIMLFCCIDLDRCYWLDSPECAGFGPRGCWGIDETLGLWIESRSGLLGLIVVYIWHVHLIRCYDYGFYSYMIRWWCMLMIACRPESHVE